MWQCMYIWNVYHKPVCEEFSITCSLYQCSDINDGEIHSFHGPSYWFRNKFPPILGLNEDYELNVLKT